MRILITGLWLLIFGLSQAPASPAEEDSPALLGYDFESAAETSWVLPKELKEVSGMALSDDGRLFVHEEKRANIHEIDFIQGQIVKTFSFGRPPAKKDFEGMAIAGKRFFLINEKGLLLEGREGFNFEGKVFNSYDTGFGEFCEIEGLAAAKGKLLVLCRKAEEDAYEGFLTIFSWDLDTRQADEAPFLKIPLEGEGMPEALADIEPSGLEVLENGNLLVLSTGERLILELTPEGQVLGYRRLHKKRHDNPEGIAMTKDGRLIISDEGSPATIQIYDK